MRRNRTWPKTPSNLSNRLRGAAPSLRRIGVSVEFDRSGSKRSIRLAHSAETPSLPSSPSFEARKSLNALVVDADEQMTGDDGLALSGVTSKSLRTNHNDGDDGDDGEIGPSSGWEMTL